jgi:CRP/FNR family cyclic AMP-dependent transcriptional regulator
VDLATHRGSPESVPVSVRLRALPSVSHVLRQDPDLLEAIATPDRERAIDECIAPLAQLARGRWTGEWPERLDEAIGLLVLQGLLVRRVGIDGRYGAELLGQGDILRPWQREDAGPTIPHTTGWRVLEPTQVALLDSRVAHRLARYPALTGRLVGRALERSRTLAVNMAIVHQPRVEVRLQMLFWHLADRWGRVCPEGVVVPLRLTHSVLADLVAARRPTVSTSLSELAQRQVVQPVGDEWLLAGEPPVELLELQEVAVRSGPVDRSPADLRSPSPLRTPQVGSDRESARGSVNARDNRRISS